MTANATDVAVKGAKAVYSSTAKLDLLDPEFIADPYPTYDKFRSIHPICYIDDLQTWFLTRQADIRAVLRDERVQRNYEQFQILRMGPNVVNEPYYRMAKETVLFVDGVKHRTLKKIFKDRFGRRRAQEFRQLAKEVVNGVIDTFIMDGETDIANTLAHQVPLQLISAIMGVPLADQPLLADWLEAWGHTAGVSPMTPTELANANDAAKGFEEYFRQLIKSRYAKPGEDFVTELLAYNKDLDEPFDEFSLVSNLMLMYFGGQDTQQKQFGIILEALDHWPQQLAWLKEDPRRVWTSSGEMMRFDAVGQFSNRIATETLKVGDVTIEAGDALLVSWGAGNRDPEVYDRPAELNLQRENQGRDLTFGAGQHACAGVHIALLTVPMMLEAVLTRMPDYVIARAGVVRRQSSVVRGFDHLPVKWDPASARSADY